VDRAGRIARRHQERLAFAARRDARRHEAVGVQNSLYSTGYEDGHFRAALQAKKWRCV